MHSVCLPYSYSDTNNIQGLKCSLHSSLMEKYREGVERPVAVMDAIQVQSCHPQSSIQRVCPKLDSPSVSLAVSEDFSQQREAGLLNIHFSPWEHRITAASTITSTEIIF